MPPPVDLPKGAISFEPLAEIATGETARVDLCRGTGANAGALYAVKRLHRHIAEDPQFAAMFQDEVWMTASLKHKNVVEVAGWGTTGGRVPGRRAGAGRLARALDEDRVRHGRGLLRAHGGVHRFAPLPRPRRGPRAARSRTASCSAWCTAISRRATSSSASRGDVKIADFGLAKAKQRLTKTLTGCSRASPQYMAPEQARRRGDRQPRRSLLAGRDDVRALPGRKPWSPRATSRWCR
jgi:serine/threonine protein kinase